MPRQESLRVALRKEGRFEEADAIAPPSERKLTPEEKCGARNATNGKPCRLAKGSGTLHVGYGYCLRHGGNTQAGIKAAMREMGHDLIEQYKAQYERFGGNRNDPSIMNLTPEQALLEEVRRSAAMVRFLEERIAHWNLTPVEQSTLEAFVKTSTRTGKDFRTLRGDVEAFLAERVADNNPGADTDTHLPNLTNFDPKTGLTSFTDAREWLLMYREERGHLARTAKMCLDAGVAQRIVSIAEDQGRILATAIRAVLRALDLSPEQANLVPQVVPPILRAVAADQPIPELNIVRGELA